MSAQRWTSTGAESLDAQLGGGLRQAALTVAYGEPASGKTTLAMTAVARHLEADPAAKAVYFDADGKFSLARLGEIMGSAAPRLMKRFLFTKLDGFAAQAQAVEALAERVEPGDLVVLDSVTGLYRVETGDSLKTWAENKELNRQLGFLKEVALTRRVALLATGQVRSVLDSPTPSVEPVAQRLLRYWSDAVIRIEHTQSQGLRRVTVEKPETRRGALRVKIASAGFAEEDQAW